MVGMLAAAKAGHDKDTLYIIIAVSYTHLIRRKVGKTGKK